MYHTDSHPDPYANQYPPPPPLVTEHHSGHSYPTSGATTAATAVAATSSYIPPPPQPSYTPPHQIYPQSQYSASAAMPMMTGRQDVPAVSHDYHSVPINSDPKPQYDPQALTMNEYRLTEQDEQLYNSGYGQHHNPQGYYMDYRDEPDMSSAHTPMVQTQQSSQQTIRPEDPDDYKSTAQQNKHSPHSNNTNNNNNKKYTAGPLTAPEDEAAAYRPKYYDHDDDRRGGCNCCCYNPAMTFCSCFCFLISLGFLAAGIALIIAAKVIGDKCSTQCGDAMSQAASYGIDAKPCDAICGKVVHDGMFYGGIVVAGLAAIAAIWKIFMWLCAGMSRR